MNEYIVLILYCVLISTLTELACSMDKEDHVHLMTPLYFYNKNMNWFGAYSCVLLLAVVSPLMFIFKIVKWLFTVGR